MFEAQIQKSDHNRDFKKNNNKKSYLPLYGKKHYIYIKHTSYY